jgi:YYY domain-containing protein
MFAFFVVWWILWLLLGLGFEPWAERIFGRLPDRGYAFAKPLALVVFAYTGFLLTSFGLGHGKALGVAALLLAAAGAVGWRQRATPFDVRERGVQEGLFLGALAFFAFARALLPDIYGAEKYMDFAFFNTLVRAEHFPPEDPWLAGVATNYYYFGYLLFADLARVSGVPSEVAYNLSLASVGAVGFTAAVSLGRWMTGRLAWGIAGGVALVLAGNLDGALQLFEGKGIAHFDYWRSTRVVSNTINEFPFFSLLHGDLHPHVAALVLNVTIVAVAAALAQALIDEGMAALRRPLAPALLVLLLGALSIANPWDVPVYLTLLGLLALHALWDPTRPIRSLLPPAVCLGALVAGMTLLGLPFTIGFHAQYGGIGRVHDRTVFASFAVVFGLLLAPPLSAILRQALRSSSSDDAESRDFLIASGVFSYVVLVVATENAVLVLLAGLVVVCVSMLLGPSRRSPLGADPARSDVPALALVLLGAAATALLACEIVYLKDPYGVELHRMNTVFKLYFQAWLLLAIALPAFVRRLIADLGLLSRAAASLALALGLAASLCYPTALLGQRWSNARKLTLDGLAYLDREHPGDAAAIRWIRSEVSGRPVVLEATGDPYSYFARVSSNTGLPTVVGWANHEGVWRGHEPRLDERKRDVETMYRETNMERVQSLLAQYGVRYVFVGDLEREHYEPAGLDKFTAHPELFGRIFHSGTTEVFEVR